MDFPRANSIQQASWKILNNFEVLRRVKEYDTPYAMRSFSRIYIFLLPIFYGPYFIYLANQTNLFISLSFNIFAMCGITSLFHILDSLETPFDEEGIDDIRVTSEAIQFKNDLQFLFVKSDQFRTFEDQIKIDKLCYVKTYTIKREERLKNNGKIKKQYSFKRSNTEKHSYVTETKDNPIDESSNTIFKFARRFIINKVKNDINKVDNKTEDQQNDKIFQRNNKKFNKDIAKIVENI